MLAVCAVPVLLTACGGGEGAATGPAPTPPVTVVDAPSDLANPASKEIAMKLVASAENSTLDWRDQYGYIDDIADGRGLEGSSPDA